MAAPPLVKEWHEPQYFCVSLSPDCTSALATCEAKEGPAVLLSAPGPPAASSGPPPGVTFGTGGRGSGLAASVRR